MKAANQPGLAAMPAAVKHLVEAVTSVRRSSWFTVFSWLVVIVTLSLTIYPVARLVDRAFASSDGLFAAIAFVWSRPWIGPVLIDTMVLVIVSSFVAVLIAALFAWISERTDASLGWFGEIIPLLPLILPQITVVIGWVFLASPGIGFVTQPLERIGIYLDLYSMTGLIILYAMSLVPFGYIVLSSAMRNLDSSLEEAARVSGASLLTTLKRVSIPAILPTIGSAALLVMIQALSFYAIPSIIAGNAGIEILAVRIVSVVRQYPPDLTTSAVLSIILAGMIAPLWFMQRHIASLGQGAQMGGRGAGGSLVSLGRWRIAARSAVLLYLLVFSVLPFIALLIVSLEPYWTPRVDISTLGFHNFKRVLFENLLTRKAFFNSITIGIVSGLTTMTAAFVFVLFIRHSAGRIAAIVDGVSKVPVLIPHVAFGLAFLISLGGEPFNLAGTLAILIIANTVMFLPQACITAEAAVRQVGADLEEVARVNGAGRGWIAIKILLPLMAPGLIGGWGLIFILSAAELAAAQLLSTGATPVIGAVIYDIYGGGTFGPLAALAVTIAVISVTVISIASVFARMATRWRRA